MDTFQILGTLAVLWIVYYAAAFGRKPTVTFSKDNQLLQSIVSECKSFRRTYWPTFIIFANNWVQTFWVGFKSHIYSKSPHKLPPYERELFTHSDGQTVALDWVFNNNNRENELTPIVVYQYGITGSNDGFNEVNVANMVNKDLKWHFVIINRRGHDSSQESLLTIPKMTVFGYLDDIHACMVHIHKKYPNNPLVMYGNSAGTGIIVRYLGDLGIKMRLKTIGDYLKHVDNDNNNDGDEKINEVDNINGRLKSAREYYDKLTQLNKKLELEEKYEEFEGVLNNVIGGVCICPGYDIACCFERLGWFSQNIIFRLLKDTFVDHTNNVGFPSLEAFKKREFNSLSQFLRLFATEISGYDTYEHYLLENNPLITAPYILQHMLIINSLDDPICLKVNVNDWRHLFIPDYDNVKSDGLGQAGQAGQGMDSYGDVQSGNDDKDGKNGLKKVRLGKNNKKLGSGYSLLNNDGNKEERLSVSIDGKSIDDSDDIEDGGMSKIDVMMKDLPNLILMETKFGAHCAFFDIRGNVWTNLAVTEYLQAVQNATQ